MKTAEEILEGKGCNRFDLTRVCEEIESYFEGAGASSRLLISGRYFDETRRDADFHGYIVYQGDEAVQEFMSSGAKTEKLGYIGLDFAFIEVESSCVRKLIAELKSNKFYTERVSPGFYIVTMI